MENNFSFDQILQRNKPGINLLINQVLPAMI